MKPTQTVMFRTADLPLFSNTAQTAHLETYAPKPAMKQPELPTATHHVIIYNNKRVVMDYIENPKEEFKYACMRISDNNATGIVITPDGKQYQVTPYSKTARLIDPRTITPPAAPVISRWRSCDNCGEPITGPNDILCERCKARIRKNVSPQT